MSRRTRAAIAVAAVFSCAMAALVLLKMEHNSTPPTLPRPFLAGEDPAVPASPRAVKRGVNCDRGGEVMPPSLSPPQTTGAATTPAGPAEKNSTFARPEETGEDFSKLESSEVLRRLTQSNDRIAERKAAKVLGDRHLAGELNLSQGEKEDLKGYVSKQIALTAAAKGNDWEEANQQIRRLWRLAASTLISNLGSENLTVVEAATKNLALMRNEEIIQEIVARIEASEDAAFRRYAILALGMMREKRDCLVPDRKALSDEKSAKIAESIIVPFLEKMKRTEKDPEALQCIDMAFQFLERPMDTRPQPSGGR